MDTENKNILEHLLREPNAEVDPSWVLDMSETYPTFVLPAILLLKRNPDAVDEETRRRLQILVALNSADKTALMDYIDPAGEDWSHFYPTPEAPKNTTEQTIDEFLLTYGQPATPEEDSVLERLLFNPVPADYFADTDEPYDPSDPLALPPELRGDDVETEETEAQEAAEEEIEPQTPTEPEESTDESMFMESLAKIFIKQRRYERAYEIISKLSLNYPEKSVYFADQLRFLQKLIINQQYTNK